MDLNKLRQVVKKHFYDKFDNEYKLNYELKEITDIKEATHINFIVCGRDGVVADFWVSNNSIYKATIKGDMARSYYEIECWHDFMGDLEKELNEIANKEIEARNNG